MGVSHSGRTTKIYGLVDAFGRPLRLILTPANASDVKAADQLIGATASIKQLIANRGSAPTEPRFTTYALLATEKAPKRLLSTFNTEED